MRSRPVTLIPEPRAVGAQNRKSRSKRLESHEQDAKRPNEDETVGSRSSRGRDAKFMRCIRPRAFPKAFSVDGLVIPGSASRVHGRSMPPTCSGSLSQRLLRSSSLQALLLLPIQPFIPLKEAPRRLPHGLREPRRRAPLAPSAPPVKPASIRCTRFI